MLPKFASTTRVDNEGNWLFQTPTSVEPGFHQVFVQDDEGNEDSFPLYIAEGEKIFVVDKQTETLWLERVQTIFPPALAYALIGLTFLLLLATIFVIWLSRRRSRRVAISAVILIITMAALGALYLNHNVGVPLIESGQSNDQGQVVDVRGKVEAPFQNQPVAGVDLTLGDTSIKTETSGQFVFPRARTGDVIRMNHPMLKRAIGWRVTQGGTIVIPFDADLFYALDVTLEAELGPINDQLLILSGVQRDEQAKKITLEVDRNGKTEKIFEYISGGWRQVME